MRSNSANWPCLKGNAIPVFTSGIRAIRGSVHAGAATSIIQFGCSDLSILNKLCASTISPTQAGPNTSILGDASWNAAILTCPTF